MLKPAPIAMDGDRHIGRRQWVKGSRRGLVVAMAGPLHKGRCDYHRKEGTHEQKAESRKPKARLDAWQAAACWKSILGLCFVVSIGSSMRRDTVKEPTVNVKTPWQSNWRCCPHDGDSPKNRSACCITEPSSQASHLHVSKFLECIHTYVQVV